MKDKELAKLIKKSDNPHKTLADELTDMVENNEGDYGKIGEFVNNLKRDLYHDFKTTIATPKTKMSLDLVGLGFSEIAQLVVDGIFDEKID